MGFQPRMFKFAMYLRLNMNNFQSLQYNPKTYIAILIKIKQYNIKVKNN